MYMMYVLKHKTKTIWRERIISKLERKHRTRKQNSQAFAYNRILIGNRIGHRMELNTNDLTTKSSLTS